MAETPEQREARLERRRARRRELARAASEFLDRVLDANAAPETLSRVELAAREWRQEVIGDLGGANALPATKRALLDACTGSWLLLMSLDATVFSLAQLGGLVNRQRRRAFGIVLDRMQVADSLTRQLQRLGLERRAKPVPDLAEYLRGRYPARAPAAGQGGGAAPAPEEEPHDDHHDGH